MIKFQYKLQSSSLQTILIFGKKILKTKFDIELWQLKERILLGLVRTFLYLKSSQVFGQNMRIRAHTKYGEAGCH